MTPADASRHTLTLGPCRIEYTGNDQTRLLGVVGHPVSHSLSPRMQQAALDAANRNVTYVPMDVPASELVFFLQQVRRTPTALQGFNVTIPHKNAVVDLMDGIDDGARLAAAVNTVVIDAERRLHGFNTDIAGLLEVWRQNDVVVRGQRMIIVGAGGLARAAVVAALQEAAAEICVLNRNVGHAQAMLDDVGSRWLGGLPRLSCAALGAHMPRWLADASCLVQATPVGMAATDAAPLTLQGSSPRLFVLEGLYGTPTRLLDDAMQHNLRCTDGRSLLVAQGAAAWRLWMQAEPDIEVMRKAVASSPS